MVRGLHRVLDEDGMSAPLRVRALPLLVVDSVVGARNAGHAIFSAGIGQVEIALRTAQAVAAAEAVIADGELQVALGTVITPDQVELAADIGASFIVSPGLFPEVLQTAHSLDIPAIPGVATPTEAVLAARYGAPVVKVYPVAALGGVAFIDALAAITPESRFMPSGGVSAENAAAYLGHPAVAAISGSWMAPRILIDEGDFASIEERCRQALEVVR